MKRGEAQARTFLEERGYKIIAANYRCPWGEVDLIARDGAMLAFVEVKTRRSTIFGAAEEAVTAAKGQRLLRCAEHYLGEQGLDVPWRVDVVAVTIGRKPGEPPRLTLVQNAVTGDEPL